MKKVNVIRWLKLVALALPILLFVLFTQHYLFYYTDHNAERIRRFYQEEENSLDVVFLGASDVFTGYAPALAYETHGITSYMYAIDANPGRLYQYQLKEVLSRQNPQLVLVEVNGFMYDMPVEEEKLRTMTENIPMSANELEMIFRFKDEDKLSCLIPFVTYHGNWEQGRSLMDQFSWKVSTAKHPSMLKGMLTHSVIDTRTPEEIELSKEQLEQMKVAETVLMEFIGYCREEKLNNVVFVRFPHKSADKQADLIDQIETIVRKNGYSFLNLENHKEAMGLEVTRDYYNSEHLNIYGQEKMTPYLADLMVSEFGIVPTSQSESNRAHWETCAGYYHDYYAYVDEQIAQNTDIWPCEDILTFQQFLDWRQSRS